MEGGTERDVEREGGGKDREWERNITRNGRWEREGEEGEIYESETEGCIQNQFRKAKASSKMKKINFSKTCLNLDSFQITFWWFHSNMHSNAILNESITIINNSPWLF